MYWATFYISESVLALIAIRAHVNYGHCHNLQMLFLWLLSAMLSTTCTASAVQDQTCKDDICSCCIDRECGFAQGFNHTCLKGCIDGHRGARCYELCQYPNCKSCGDTGPTSECTKCYDGYYLGSKKDCTSQCPSNCKSCTSSTMCTECKEGFYDKDCTSQCPSNCKSCTSNTMCTECKDGFYDKDGSTTCNYAHCPGNCECNDQGDCVSCKKGYHDTSASCTKQCPVNCLTCVSAESCNECKDGFYNGYKYDNNTNLLLNNCTYPCRGTCTQCQSYNGCSQCKEGKYGGTCQEDCSVGCKDKTCLVDTGQCECTVDFTGDKCMKCVDGKYGLFCKETCSKYCKDGICERTSGNCSAGCINDNITGNTCNTCTVGIFGELCDNICPENCKDIRCERYSGICSEGCTNNFNGTKCDICIHGKYGTKCDINCPVHCTGNVCNISSGACFDCDENFRGEMCDECRPGYFGANCNLPCSAYCSNSSCNRDNGDCLNGCTIGYSGDKCCVMSTNCMKCGTNARCKTCVPGFFDNSCNKTCPRGCSDSCDISTGECVTIEIGQIDDTIQLAGPVGGGVAALLVVIVGIIASVFFLRRRRIQKDSRNEVTDNAALSPKRSGERIEPIKKRPAYVNTKGMAKKDSLSDID